MDKLMEQYSDVTPYGYVHGNPISNYDPNGMLTQNDLDYINGLYYGSSSGKETTYSFSNGLYSSYSSSFSSMSSSEFSGVYNFVMGGGTGSYTYWTGDAMPSNYSYSNGDQYRNIQGLIAHQITLTSNQPQLSISHYNFNTHQSESSNIFGDIDWNKINKGIEGFAFGNEIKTQMIDYAIRNNFKTATSAKAFNALRATQQEWRIVNTLGKNGAKYLKVAKGLGTVATIATTAYTVGTTVNYYRNGGDDWRVGAKAGVDLVMTGVGFLGPIGFGVSATYFILDSATGGFGGFGEIPEN